MTRKIALGVLVLLLVAPLGVFAGASEESEGGRPVVKIAFIGPVTGPNAAVGIGAQNSFELKVAEVTADPNYPYTVEVIYEDDASDPATGVSAATKVCSDPDVVAAGTHWNSPVGLATVDVFHRFGVAQVLWGTIHPDITYGNDYREVTRVIPMSRLQNERAAELGVVEFGRERWVIVHDTTDYGTKNRDEFAAAVESRGGEVVGQFGVNVGQQDFMGVLTSAKNANPDGIYYGGVVTEAALVKTQAERIGMDSILFMGMAGMQSDTFGEIAGDAAEGSFCSGTFDVAATEGGLEFERRYNAVYDEPYEQNGPYAYDAAGVILDALEAAGPDKAAIVDYIADHDYDGVVGNIEFDDHGQNISGGLTMYVNQDGMWVRWLDSEYFDGSRSLPWE